MAPSLVQSQSATAASSSSVTVTLGSNTTAGNCLIVCVVTSSSPNPTVTGITLGGSAGNFAQSVTVGNPAVNGVTTVIWADPNCAGSQTSVVVSLSAASGSVDIMVMEWSGLATSSIVDQTAGQALDTGVTAWTSTASGTTTQASEVAIGCVGGFIAAGIGTITGPGGAWTNLTQVTSASNHVGLLAGYDVLSSTGTVTYSGTMGSGGSYAAVVATFKTPAGSHTDTAAVTVTPVTSAPRVHAAVDTAADTVTPVTSAPRVHGHADTAADTVTPVLSASAIAAAGQLLISIASSAGLDPVNNSPYKAGINLYGPNGEVLTLGLYGGVLALTMTPPGMTANTVAPDIFGAGLNTGAANERALTVVTSGKENNLADAALQLYSESADGTIGANALIEFGGTVVLSVAPAGATVFGNLAANNFSGSYAGGQSAPGWPIATGSGTIGPSNLAPSFSNALNALYNAMVNAGLI